MVRPAPTASTQSASTVNLSPDGSQSDLSRISQSSTSCAMVSFRKSTRSASTCRASAAESCQPPSPHSSVSSASRSRLRSVLICAIVSIALEAMLICAIVSSATLCRCVCLSICLFIYLSACPVCLQQLLLLQLLTCVSRVSFSRTERAESSERRLERVRSSRSSCSAPG